MLCDLDQMLSNTVRRSAVAVLWAMTVAIAVAITIAVAVAIACLRLFNAGFVLELRSIKRRRESVG